jgi:hypothetical protein
MKKVKNIYLADAEDKLGKHCATGLIIELVDGEFYCHQSTDVIMPFEKIENPPPITIT